MSSCTDSARCGHPGCSRCGFGPPVSDAERPYLVAAIERCASDVLKRRDAGRQRLALLADVVRFQSWPYVTVEIHDTEAIDGDNVSGRLGYDSLPPDVRELIEAIPGLIEAAKRAESEGYLRGASDVLDKCEEWDGCGAQGCDGGTLLGDLERGG